MEIRRQDSLGFNGDSSSKIPPSTCVPSRTNHHQTLNNNHQISRPNIDSSLLISDPTSAATNRSISRSPPPASTKPIQYKECLKNHAASMGGLVLDGCGEFMPMGKEGSAEALKCAACECHRNFHRKEIHGESPQTNHNPLPLPIAPNRGFSTVMMSFGGGAAESSSDQDLNMFASALQGEGSIQRVKKRFRTKFSQEQKEMMMEFAERLGWKIQKQDEQQVNQFCSSIGTKRKIFKVWMHNNKQAIKKKQM